MGEVIPHYPDPNICKSANNWHNCLHLCTASPLTVPRSHPTIDIIIKTFCHPFTPCLKPLSTTGIRTTPPKFLKLSIPTRAFLATFSTFRKKMYTFLFLLSIV